MKFKHLIDDITIDFYSSENFANMKHTRKKKCNPTTHYSKFTSNKRIISGVRAFGKLYSKIKWKWLARQNYKDDFSLNQVAIHSVAIISPIQ